MNSRSGVTRRNFVGGLAGVVSYAGWSRGGELLAQAARAARTEAPGARPKRLSVAEYEKLAKLASNENPYGPSESVLKAMTDGFKYANPYGVVVAKQEVKQLLDAIPEDVPVLIDEAYHHFVQDPNYATSVPYVLEGRQVIVTRTFSKIAALAGMRLGYGIAPKELIERMRTFSTGSISAVVKWGGVAALNDTANEVRVKKVTSELRDKVTSQLRSMGHDVIPSEANFFMVHISRDVVPVIEEFRKKNVLVGRPFPPMVQHLRVSIGTESEMNRFMAAFKEIIAGGKTSALG